MEIAVLTIFPEMFAAFWAHGIIRRAVESNRISVSTINIRDFAEGRHLMTDDRPYGGGCGMVMKPEPLAASLRAVKRDIPDSDTILMTPQGRIFDQSLAKELSRANGLIFVCGRYEGVDERFRKFADSEISLGDYVLTGGEIPAMAVIDAVTRLIPGVLGGADSAEEDSFSQGLLEYPHYTRPRSFEGEDVPDVLLSGHHQQIAKWRAEASLIRTFLKRPDLLRERPLNAQETDVLKKWHSDIGKIIQTQSLCGTDPLSGDQ